LYGSLPWKSNYCFICTWYYSNTFRWTGKRYFIFIGFIILVYIYLILNTDGSRVREITTDGYNYNLLYSERNDQLLLRQNDDRLCCINLDGHVIYRYDILGFVGLAVEQNIKILHQQNIKIFHLQNIKILHLQNIKIFHLQNIKIFFIF
jgi:hypothetical protein